VAADIERARAVRYGSSHKIRIRLIYRKLELIRTTMTSFGTAAAAAVKRRERINSAGEVNKL
jgi:hypothetical protein